jgi:hypothetical protein
MYNERQYILSGASGRKRSSRGHTIKEGILSGGVADVVKKKVAKGSCNKVYSQQQRQNNEALDHLYGHLFVEHLVPVQQPNHSRT